MPSLRPAAAAIRTRFDCTAPGDQHRVGVPCAGRAEVEPELAHLVAAEGKPGAVVALYIRVDAERRAEARGGGRPNRVKRRRIAPPAEVLPRWHRGIETAERNPVARDAFRSGLYTGMRRAEVFGLRWSQLDMRVMTLRVEETKTDEPLELPITRQLSAILERRLAERERFPEPTRPWVFPSDISRSGHLEGMQHLNARIGEPVARGSGITRFATASLQWPTASSCCRRA